MFPTLGLKFSRNFSNTFLIPFLSLSLFFFFLTPLFVDWHALYYLIGLICCFLYFFIFLSVFSSDWVVSRSLFVWNCLIWLFIAFLAQLFILELSCLILIGPSYSFQFLDTVIPISSNNLS